MNQHKKMFLGQLEVWRLLFWIVTSASFVCLIVLQIHNVLLLPVTRGFDARAHIEYIHTLATTHHIPLANQGWELYQPPLYYFLATLLTDLKFVQLLGFCLWIILFIVSTWFFKLIYQDDLKSIVGGLLVITVPVILYLTPTISNEFFAGVAMMIAMMQYVVQLAPEFEISKLQQSPRPKIIFGILLGLALLSKATALVLVIAIVIDRLWKSVASFSKSSANSGFLFSSLL